MVFVPSHSDDQLATCSVAASGGIVLKSARSMDPRWFESEQARQHLVSGTTLLVTSFRERLLDLIARIAGILAASGVSSTNSCMIVLGLKGRGKTTFLCQVLATCALHCRSSHSLPAGPTPAPTASSSSDPGSAMLADDGSASHGEEGPEPAPRVVFAYVDVRKMSSFSSESDPLYYLDEIVLRLVEEAVPDVSAALRSAVKRYKAEPPSTMVEAALRAVHVALVLVLDEVETLYQQEFAKDEHRGTEWMDFIRDVGETPNNRPILLILAGSAPRLRQLLFAKVPADQVEVLRSSEGYTYYGSIGASLEASRFHPIEFRDHHETLGQLKESVKCLYDSLGDKEKRVPESTITDDNFLQDMFWFTNGNLRRMKAWLAGVRQEKDFSFAHDIRLDSKGGPNLVELLACMAMYHGMRRLPRRVATFSEDRLDLFAKAQNEQLVGGQHVFPFRPAEWYVDFNTILELHKLRRAVGIQVEGSSWGANAAGKHHDSLMRWKDMEAVYFADDTHAKITFGSAWHMVYGILCFQYGMGVPFTEVLDLIAASRRSVGEIFEGFVKRYLSAMLSNVLLRSEWLQDQYFGGIQFKTGGQSDFLDTLGKFRKGRKPDGAISIHDALSKNLILKEVPDGQGGDLFIGCFVSEESDVPNCTWTTTVILNEGASGGEMHACTWRAQDKASRKSEKGKPPQPDVADGEREPEGNSAAMNAQTVVSIAPAEAEVICDRLDGSFYMRKHLIDANVLSADEAPLLSASDCVERIFAAIQSQHHEGAEAAVPLPVEGEDDDNGVDEETAGAAGAGKSVDDVSDKSSRRHKPLRLEEQHVRGLERYKRFLAESLPDQRIILHVCHIVVTSRAVGQESQDVFDRRGVHVWDSALLSKLWPPQLRRLIEDLDVTALGGNPHQHGL